MLKFVTSIFFSPQLARLSSEDMKIVNNMRLLAGSLNSKKSSTDFSLKFDGQKVKKLKLFKWMLKTRVRSSLHKALYFLDYDYQTKQAARKERPGEEETWALFKFYPIIEVLALSPLP